MTPPRSRGLALALLVLLHAVYALASTGRTHTTDERMALFQGDSLASHGSTAVEQTRGDLSGPFYGKLDPEGRRRAPYAPGHALAATPWILAGKALARPATFETDPNRYFLVVGFCATLSSAAFAAAAAALAFALWRRLGVPERPAVGAALALGLGTPLLGYAGWFFSEPLAAAVLVGAALALFGGRPGAVAQEVAGARATSGGSGGGVGASDTAVAERDGGVARSDARAPVSLERAALAGVLLGAAVWVRPTQVIAAPAFGIALLARDGWAGLRAGVVMALAFAAGPLAYLAYNEAIFGRALEFGYPDAVEGGKRLNDFSTPLWRGLAGFLVSPGKSILLFAPPLLFVWASLRSVARRDRGLAALAVAAPLVYLLFYARYAQWEGGYCFGPRYLVPAIALACLGLGPALADASARGRRALFALALCGGLVHAVGLSTSFLESQRPEASGYYDPPAEGRPPRFTYQLTHSPVTSQAALFLRYATSAGPAPLGKGMDRWFVFLSKAGVSSGALWALAGALAASGVAAGMVIARRLRAPKPGA